MSNQPKSGISFTKFINIWSRFEATAGHAFTYIEEENLAFTNSVKKQLTENEI
jgi:hypothetical protein